jgi:hypothetical protein
MGNNVITPSSFNSFRAGIEYLKSNKDKYDTELYNKIMLDYTIHFGGEGFTTRYDSGTYVNLSDDQYKAYKRIVELVKNAKIVSKSNKSKDEQKDNVDVEGYNGTNKPSAPDSTDN